MSFKHRWMCRKCPIHLTLISLSYALLFYPQSITACQICIPIPTTTAADKLIDSEIVVLAREDPDESFSLKTIEVLKGDPGDPKIDLFLDSNSRRVLKRFPDRSIVCVKKTADGEWERIGMMKPDFDPVVREILSLQEDWKTNPSSRPKYFSQYLGAEDSQLSRLAHIEVSRAPYDQIKSFSGNLPVEDLRAYLAEVRYIEWHALYILLLAQSGEEQDLSYIEERVRSSARFSTTIQLAAWTTAWIETKEEEAMPFVMETYLKNPRRSPEEMRAVLLALSVHGTNGHTHLRDSIVDGYNHVLKNFPAMADVIVGDLTKWQRFELGDAVTPIVRNPPEKMELKTIMQLRAYLKEANEEQNQDNIDMETNEADEQDSNWPTMLAIIGGILLVVLLPIISGIRRRDTE